MYRKIFTKNIAAPILGGLISGGGSLLSSGLQLVGASMTNKTNKEIAESNNKAMLQAMREQTKSEQDYNSAAAQMQRAMVAGLNPMTLANQGPTSASAAGVPSLDSPVMENPFAGFDLGTNQIGSAIITARQQELQSEQLDIADFNSKVDMLRTIGELAKNSDLTSDDINMIIRSVAGDNSPNAPQLSTLFKDQHLKTRLENGIEESNLSLNEKKYLYSWLDEMINAQYLHTLAEIENKQTSSNLNRALESMNEEKKKEIKQAIKNMQEQWKSLNFQGELDAQKLLNVSKIAESLVKEISSSARISEQEARFYLWSQINQTISSLPVVGSGSVSYQIK